MLTICRDSLLDVFGGVATALLLAGIGWCLFRLLRWPHAGPWAMLAMLGLVPGAMRQSFLQMAMLFLALCAACLTPEGMAWRRRDRLHRLFHLHNARALRGRPGAGPVPRHLV
jgi:hypothetical protein